MLASPDVSGMTAGVDPHFYYVLCVGLGVLKQSAHFCGCPCRRICVPEICKILWFGRIQLERLDKGLPLQESI